jgi:transcriptional antiterminator RfaH
MTWYVLYTKPQNEKKVAAILSLKGIEVYCPLHTVVKQWSDRKKKVVLPIFKSYVFVALENYVTGNSTVLNIRGSVRFLWWLGKPAVVRDEEIETIKNFLNEYKNVPVTAEISEGQNVRVTEGVFKDREGKVIKIKGKRAVLHIASLGWNISAEINLQALV